MSSLLNEPQELSGYGVMNSSIHLTTKQLDRIERIIVLLFYFQLALRMFWNAYQNASPVSLILLPSEGLVVVLVMLRRSANELSARWQDWIAALLGTVLPTLVIAGSQTSSSGILAVAGNLALMGFLVQLYAKCCLGLSFGMVAANRGIRNAGPYRLVRHPIYAGYIVTHCAFMMMFPSLWNVAILGLGFLIQVYRIHVEERILSKDQMYCEYMKQVRYRIIPGIF
jgi:protein-S-isoprenylcysteine O-methyltransferase Ste14